MSEKENAALINDSEFNLMLNASWLADGDIKIMAIIMHISEEELGDLLNRTPAMAADSIFCGRPSDWKPEDSMSNIVYPTKGKHCHEDVVSRVQDLIDAKFNNGDSILEYILETEPELKSRLQDFLNEPSYDLCSG